MKNTWLHEVAGLAPKHDVVVRVTITKAAGSSPRGAGAGMTVMSDGFTGTIGGGELEHQALDIARAMLAKNDAEPWARVVRTFPLGPSLGQCCGGRVTLMFETVVPSDLKSIVVNEMSKNAIIVRPVTSGAPIAVATDRREDRDDWPLSVRRATREILSGLQGRDADTYDGYFVEPIAAPKAPLFLYGAGHVGRAAAKILAGLPFQVYWVDTARARFPVEIPEGVECIVATDPAIVASYGCRHGWHVVMTFSHALDLDICRAVMAENVFDYLGLIASETKKTRFLRKLRAENVPESVLARLHAPIGLPGIEGKEPMTIAVSLAADLLLRLEATKSTVVEGGSAKIEGEP